MKPVAEWDLRVILDDKEIHAVSIVTPNHWHALAAIWASQAGKHVYVEKPASHNIWEGRKMIEAWRKYGGRMQVGLNNRSAKNVREAIEFLHSGGIGELYMARRLSSKHAIPTAWPRMARRPPVFTMTAGSAPRRCALTTKNAATTIGTGIGTPATATPAIRARTSLISRAGE